MLRNKLCNDIHDKSREKNEETYAEQYSEDGGKRDNDIAVAVKEFIKL